MSAQCGRVRQSRPVREIADATPGIAEGCEMTAQDKAECLMALAGMHHAARIFYGNAVAAGHHQFIEFTGLMNEYIKICEEAFADGVDFRNHALTPKSFQRDYMAEKIDCIFAGSVSLVGRKAAK